MAHDFSSRAELIAPAYPPPRLVLLGTRLEPYKPASIECLSYSYETPQTIRVDRGRKTSLYPGLSSRNKASFNVPRQDALMLPLLNGSPQEAWQELQALHDALTVSLKAIADKLLEMGTYAQRLELEGGIKFAPNPLVSEVVITEDPGDLRWGSGCLGLWAPPAISKEPVLRHTAQMLELHQGLKGQAGKFCCSEWQWQELEVMHYLAVSRSSAIATYLEGLKPRHLYLEPKPETNGRVAEAQPLTPEQVEAAALGLSEKQRQRLVFALLQSLPPDVDLLDSAGVYASKSFTGWIEEQRDGKEDYFRYLRDGSRKSKKLKTKAEVLLVQRLKFRRHPWEKTLAVLSKFAGDAPATLDRLHENGVLSTMEVSEILSLVGVEAKDDEPNQEDRE